MFKRAPLPFARSCFRNLSLACAFALLNLWCFFIFGSAYTDLPDVIAFWVIVVLTIPLLLIAEQRPLASILCYVGPFQILSLLVVDGDYSGFRMLLGFSYFSLPPMIAFFMLHYYIARRLASARLDRV